MLVLYYVRLTEKSNSGELDEYPIIYQLHAVERMSQRKISEEDIEHIILNGEVIAKYPDDTPYPSEILLGWRNARPIVVATDHVHRRKFVITAYIPDSNKWIEDFRRRKS